LRKVVLYSEQTWSDGTLDTIHVETLQSPLWLELFDVAVGADVPPPLDLVEMGLPEDLMTTVTAVEPCPQLKPGNGRVVLTTVNHLNNDVWELTAVNAEGRREQLQPTGFHKFYSETRRDWVSTKDIHDNEVIRGRAGPLTIVDSRQIPGTERVYNLTVEGEHVYYVSELGLLAHNNHCAPNVSVPRTTVSIDARAVQFSQSNVRQTLPQITQSMRANGWQGAPIDVVRMSDGTLIAVDNTRLAAAKLTGTPVQAKLRSFDEAFPVLRDPDNLYFTNPVTGGRAATWGEAVFNRMNRQNPIWIQQYPMGSPFTGVHSGSGSVLP